MAVPKFYVFFGSFLKSLSDGQVHTPNEVRSFIEKDMNLSNDDLSEMIPCGRQSTFSNRVHWARTYLNKAGLIETPSRGKYKITKEGSKALSSGKVIDLEFLEQFDSFKEFHLAPQKSDSVATTQKSSDGENLTPTEVMDSAFKQISDGLASELLDEVMKLSPTDFEKLVVQLLLKMGYGDGIEGAGIVTRPTADEGIDGIIKEDQLGFDNIYIQAKHWAVDKNIGSPEIQKFAGALHGQKATKGLFITTAGFSSKARDYAENCHGLTLVLIDGAQLMKLMIKYNLGVSVEHVYEIKRIDSDFFNESL